LTSGRHHLRKPRITAIIGLFVILMLLVACGEPDLTIEGQAQGQASGEPQGEILFIADHNVMRWDGKVEQVTRGIHAASPSWAPAGDRFAYVAVNEAFSDVIVARRDGSPLVAVTEDHEPPFDQYSEEYVNAASWAWDVDWSPVGEQLIFVSDKGGGDRYSRPLFLWFSETFAVGPYLLNASAAIEATQESPTFSPDGDSVAFVVRNDYGADGRLSEIWLLDLNSATYEQFIINDAGAYAPDWSPDGKFLAHVQRTAQSNDIWIAPVNGDDPYQITNIGAVTAPVWSPDGRFIAFFRENQGDFEAWYVEVTEGPDGRLLASDAKHLFSADNIDTVSGMSWHQR
jgi:TolB protein